MNKNNKKLFIAVIALLGIFVVGMLVWIGVLYAKENALDNELAEKQEELTLILEENDALEALINDENETALMEENAHANDYVYSDERVYILE